MTKDTFRIVPRGSFSWTEAFGSLGRFSPVGHIWKGTEEDVTLSLLADGDLAPVRVRLRFDDGALVGKVSDVARRDAIEKQVARIFSLDHDGTGWGELAVAQLRPGLRPVCFASPYESACWAIVSQRISKQQAARIFAGLVEKHGHFPTPKTMQRIERIPSVPAIKIDRLHAVATAALDGALDAERLRALGDEGAPASLRRIPGIGAFWSSGIYLRACGIRDVFPDEPLSLAALARFFPNRPAAEVIDTFRPFRMWACFVLRVADAARSVDACASSSPLVSSSASRLRPLSRAPREAAGAVAARAR